MQLIDRDIPGPRRDFVGYGRHLPKVFWPNNGHVAVNLVVNYEEGSEYSKPAGDDRNDGLAEINYAMVRNIAISARSRCMSTAAAREFGG